MKKSLIALAVAGAMTAPMVAQADATLYGKFEMRLVSGDNDDLKVESDDFRIGIKGDADLGMDGVKGLYGYEFEVNPNEGPTEFASAAGAQYGSSQTLNTRKAFVGVTGGFGTVLVGQIANPAEAVPSKVGNASEMVDIYDLTPDFLGSTVAYVSPTMNGFTGYAGVVAQGQNDDSESDADVIVIGGNYAANGLEVSVAYWDASSEYADNAVNHLTGGDVALNVADDATYAGISAAYTFGATTVALGYQESTVDAAGVEYQDDVASLKVSHKIDNMTLWANYHDADQEQYIATGGDELDSQFGLGLVYGLGTQGALDIEYVDLEGETSDGDDDILSIGYTVKF